MRNQKESVAGMLALASLLFAFATVNAEANSGEISSALESPDGMHGSITGAATWTGCSGPRCYWDPLVVVQSAAETCNSDDVLGSENARTVWNGGAQRANGTAPITASNFSSAIGQQACLDVLYSAWYVEPLCVTQYETLRQFDEEFDLPPPEHSLAEACPETEHIATTALAGKPFVMEALVPSLPVSPVPPTSGAPLPVAPKPTAAPIVAKPLTRAQKLTNALKACKKQYHGKKRRLACEHAARRRYNIPHKH
jgi:hypothetical protein